MGRLTQYFECGAYVDRSNIVNISELAEQFFEKGAYMGKAIDKLAKFEDLMEKYGLNIISDIEDMFLKFKHIQHTNQALKERWEKLKELLEEDIEHNSKEYDESLCSAFQHYSATENWVLDKMQELEKED